MKLTKDNEFQRQILTLGPDMFMVEYVIERWSDPLGTLEVVNVDYLTDEFGTGHITGQQVSSEDFSFAAKEMANLIRRMVRGY